MISNESAEPVEEPPAGALPPAMLPGVGDAEGDSQLHAAGAYCSYVHDYDTTMQI